MPYVNFRKFVCIQNNSAKAALQQSLMEISILYCQSEYLNAHSKLPGGARLSDATSWRYKAIVGKCAFRSQNSSDKQPHIQSKREYDNYPITAFYSYWHWTHFTVYKYYIILPLIAILHCRRITGQYSLQASSRETQPYENRSRD